MKEAQIQRTHNYSFSLKLGLKLIAIGFIGSSSLIYQYSTGAGTSDVLYLSTNFPFWYWYTVLEP